MQTQILELKAAMAKVQESVINEENSTAGNKFETARAMGQEELDRMQKQMTNQINQFALLQKINVDETYSQAQAGALIFTSDKIFFMAIALGRIVVADKNIFVISAGSPLGQALMKKKKGDTYILGNTKGIIETIL